MFRFAIKNMAIKKGKLLLVTLSIVLSAAVALIAYNVSSQVNEGIIGTAGYYDMIIGPAGSSTQLAMNTMFFTDKPLGTIPYEIVEKLEADPNVNSVVPFTMGDSYNGARIIGTTPEFLDGKPLMSGKMFDAEFDAVIGAGVAQKYSLEVGSVIVTSHGLSEHGAEHEASPLTVTGVLAETHTAYDNAVFTSYETVWAVHGIEGHDHEDEEEHDHEHEEEEEEHDHEHEEGTVCAVLVKTASFNAYYDISQAYSADSSLLVINPATVLREVLENVDLSSKIVYILCGIILIMNIFVITVITLLNLYDARREISLMRLIGISMGKIGALYTLQNAIIGVAATALSLAASMGCLKLMRDFVADMGIVLNAARIYPFEWAIMGLVFVISVLPTLVCIRAMARKDGVGGK